MTSGQWVLLAVAAVMVIAAVASVAYRLGRAFEDGPAPNDPSTFGASKNTSLFGPRVPVQQTERQLIAVMPEALIVTDALATVQYVSPGAQRFGLIEDSAMTLAEIRDILKLVSADSVVREAEAMTHAPGFKGYIHDVGGPTANFRLPSCKEQMKNGMCAGGKHCLAPQPCGKIIVDHREYLGILRRLRALPGVKKVFIRSGIRYDYLIRDKDESFFKELVEHHVSGQLKVAPEHCAPDTLRYMGKPRHAVYEKFCRKYAALNEKLGKKQYLVPYLMSSHPGCGLREAVELAEYVRDLGYMPEQVQDFYPTPGTLSTCMYYTGLDPRTMQPVYVPTDPHEKAMQRALMQWKRPEKRPLVLEALRRTHREDLIPLLVPAEGRRAVQRSARRAEPAEVTIHNDGTYTVRPNKGRGGRNQSRGTAPARTAGGRQPSPGARFAPNGTAPRKPKNDQQKENTVWKTSKKKK